MSPIFAGLTPSGRLRRPVERILVVQAGSNPSFDYYIAPRLGPWPFEVRDLEAAPCPPGGAGWSGTLVVFCRYLSASWLDTLRRERAALAGVALFLDDDIDALFADWRVPLWYRARLFRLHLRHRRRLGTVLDLLLVSNARIAARHGVTARVLTPIAGTADDPVPREAAAGVRVAFHSTSVHRREHRWLRPALRAALRDEPRIEAEVLASWPLDRLWRGLPRTRVAEPLEWPDYRVRTARQGADLLLAPLLPGAANAARSATRRIDAMRLGAALLTNDAEIYRPGEEERRLGMCLPADTGLWAQAIVALARDPARVARLRDLNRAWVLGSTRAAASLPLLSNDTP